MTYETAKAASGISTDSSLHPDPDDRQLVENARSGDPRAMEELVRRHRSRAFRIASHLCGGNPDEAQDLTQEAFLKVFRNLGRFRGESSFSTWLYRIVVNTCLDEIRSRRRKERVLSLWPWHRRKTGDAEEQAMPEQADTAPDSDPLMQLREKQLDAELRRLLLLLPDQQRTAFQLKVFEEMSIREIARVMGTAEGTVKSHLFRATHTLREKLKDWIET